MEMKRGTENRLKKAAQYIRTATVHQHFSTENQSAVIQEYASFHSIEIVRTYADRGKSGLSLADRDGLKELLQIAESGNADFSVVLVYDFSRWGRFQNIDDSMSCESRLNRAGIQVVYCVESLAEG